MANATMTTLFMNETSNVTMTTLFMNDTVTTNLTMTTPRVRPGPPPIGYYGDTRVTLWKVVPPIIMAWGILGNILTTIILLRQVRKLSSTAIYLLALAFSDTIVLLCGPLRNWLNALWKEDVRLLSDSGCKTQVFFTYFSIQLSSWLLVAVTTERVISVILPHKVKLGCTPRNALMSIGAMFVLLCAVDIVLPVTFELKPRGSGFVCVNKDEHEEFFDDVWPWIDFFVAFAVPCLILLVGNTIIIVKLLRSRKRRKQMISGRSSKSPSQGKSVYILLFMLSAIFLLTMSPVSVFNIVYPYSYEEIINMKWPDAWYAYQYLEFEKCVVNLVGYTNAAFNFILYVFSGSKFRKELVNLLRCKPAGAESAIGEGSSSRNQRGTRSTFATSTSQGKIKSIRIETNKTS